MTRAFPRQRRRLSRLPLALRQNGLPSVVPRDCQTLASVKECSFRSAHQIHVAILRQEIEIRFNVPPRGSSSALY